jgi:polar amino acid transport system substrate-binding protein
MFKGNLIFKIIILVTMLAMVTGCGSGVNDKAGDKAKAAVTPPTTLVEKGKLTYGTAATFPPFEYMKDGNFTGFDIEMAEALAKEMGLETKTQSMTFDGLIPALNGKRTDIINSAMYIKPERAAQVDFIPYFKLGNSIVVAKGNQKGIKSMDDLSGCTVAVTRGAVEEIFCREQNQKLKAAGKAEINILALPTANDAVMATEQGRADACLHSSPGAAYLMEQKPGVFEIAGTFAAETEIGIAVRKGDIETKAAVEAALKKLVENGTYAKLMKKYNLPVEMNYFSK